MLRADIFPDCCWIIPDLAKRLTAPALNLTNAMSNWLGSYVQNPPEIEKRSDRNGKFLILRLNRDGGLLSSLMQIHSATIASPLPRFTTSRTDDDGVKREVEGVIILSNGLFYSFGKASLHGGFRATILKPLNRSDTQKNDRFDMFGARLGQQDGPELPYAYPIYCYQIKRNRTDEELHTLTGKLDEDNKNLVSQIDGLPTILRRLRHASQYRFGVLAEILK